MKIYWEKNTTNGRNYYVQINDNKFVAIWEDIGKDPHTEAGTIANFEEFLETDFYKNLVKDNMGVGTLNEVINTVKNIQNSAK